MLVCDTIDTDGQEHYIQIFCDDCGKECTDNYEEIDGKHYCSECLRQSSVID